MKKFNLYAYNKYSHVIDSLNVEVHEVDYHVEILFGNPDTTFVKIQTSAGFRTKITRKEYEGTCRLLGRRNR
jgi:hypothetical protein